MKKMKQQRIWGTLHPFIEQGPIFGRKVANAEFLAALLRKDPFDAYHFFLKERKAKEDLESFLKSRHTAMWEAGRFGIGPILDMPGMLERTDYSCFHLSDWVHDFIPASILRNAFSKTLFPLTAPTHTLSYATFGPQLLRHIWPGVTKRDRIIATSETTRSVIEACFAQFRQGYGLAPSLPQTALSRIPLGVAPDQFASPEEKALAGREVRNRLGIGESVMFLGFSRLTPMSKMDFFPIFDAFARAKAKGLDLDGCCLVLAGILPDKTLADPLVKRAREYGVRFSLLAFPEVTDPGAKKALFAAADVFLSPVDNIQETFGLTVLEAFASSLPVIASDIDGYTELVSHGTDGFLLPTLGPASAEATTALSSLLMPDLYHFLLAQQCAVDLDAFAEALFRLGTNACLRREMGRAGREKILSSYTWESVIDRHLALWEDLAATPLSGEEEARARTAKHPTLPDYVTVFRNYFTATANDPAIRQKRVRLSGKGAAVLAGKRAPALFALLTPWIRHEQIVSLLALAENPLPFGELADRTARHGRARDRDQLILWALKQGYIEFEE